MQNTSQEIALIELGNGHQECLYSQALFLKKAGYTVHLILTRKLYPYIRQDKIWDHEYLHVLKGSGSIIGLIGIAMYLKRNKIKKIIFNTAENAVVRNLLFFIPGIECFGVIHNILKLKESSTQHWISRRIKKYFVLNDYLIQPDLIPGDLKVRSLYTIFFPKYNFPDLRAKRKGELWIVIPGQLELKRRDYEGLILSLSGGIDSRVRFILLGNAKKGDGEYVLDLINKNKLTGNFISFNDYIPEEDFHAYIKNSDLVMPLIHPVNQWQKDYRRKNISGTFNFAFAYKKPLLVHDYFSGIEDFERSSIYYKGSDLPKVIQNVLKTPEILDKLSENIFNYKKFNFEYQCSKYLDFIEN